MKKYLSLLLASMLFLTLFTTACSDNDTSQPPLASGSVIVADDSIPDISPNISGIVTNISYVREGITLLIEIPEQNKNSAEGKVYVSVTSKTVVEDKDKKRYANINEIMPGDTVSVWFSGNSTGTSPEYAVAQGIRVMSHMEELLLSVRLSDSVIMASPAEGEVTSTDLSPSLYGSYLITFGEGDLQLSFIKVPTNFTVSAISTVTNENGQNSIYHFKCDIESSSCEIPSNMESGEYIVSVKAEYSEGADYYIFTLCAQ